jgi:NADH dehydrogenase [ubiquinone] 1 alpha subcomplex assembly factor 7
MGAQAYIMTPLAVNMVARIARMGPISVAEFMTECLLHPKYGYYTTRDPLGTAGDFTTAPEISQMFGELLGLWIAQTWLDQGRPAYFMLVELGPGRGTLMADVMRATASVPGFHKAATLHLVEASPVLRDLQTAALSAHKITFYDHLGGVPDGPTYLLANEFFDALPIRQFQRSTQGWQERQIGVADGQLIWGLAPEHEIEALADRVADTGPGQLVELNAPALPLAQEIGRRIAAHGGAALIIDYGEAESIGDTLQAVQSHRFVDALACPGQADLTAHVAFGPLVRAANLARASALIPQGLFLERLGITERAQILAKNLGATALVSHIAAHRRLTHPDEMGTLFKVMALTPHAAPLPPGLEPVA